MGLLELIDTPLQAYKLGVDNKLDDGLDQEGTLTPSRIPLPLKGEHGRGL